MFENREIVENTESFERTFEKVKKAQEEFSKFKQEKVDKKQLQSKS